MHDTDVETPAKSWFALLCAYPVIRLDLLSFVPWRPAFLIHPSAAHVRSRRAAPVKPSPRHPDFPQYKLERHCCFVIRLNCIIMKFAWARSCVSSSSAASFYFTIIILGRNMLQVYYHSSSSSLSLHGMAEATCKQGKNCLLSPPASGSALSMLCSCLILK